MIERIARPTALVVATLGVLLLIGAALGTDVHPDATAYWLAAERLRDGQALYGGPRGDETEIYRYAPWFAFTWLPLTYLGKDGAFLVWRGILLLSTLVAVWPLLRRPTPAALTLAILLGGLLISNLPAANVTPLVVGALAVTLRTRAGPVILGLAGSLKVFPILFVAGYLAERRWWSAAVALAATAVLWLTVLFFDLSSYASVGGPGFYVGGVSLYGVSPWIWVPVAGVLTVVVLALARARSRWTWLASATAIPLAVPRVWLPDAGYLLTGAAMVAGGPDTEP